jgi:ribulose-phosphate 3-epimerase
MSERVLIAPSILSADFACLGAGIAMVEAAGADWIHVDVMDGHFVSNLTIGPPVVRALKRVCTVPLDVHLMIDNADDTVSWYLDAGADLVTVHVEACRNLPHVIGIIKAAGAKAGVSLNPATPPSAIAQVIREIDVVLVMSVVPGFGGQAFIPSSVAKIAEIAALAKSTGTEVVIEVDGGIDETTAATATRAGARVLVAGNAIFSRPDPGEALRAIRTAGEAGVSA